MAARRGKTSAARSKSKGQRAPAARSKPARKAAPKAAAKSAPKRKAAPARKKAAVAKRAAAPTTRKSSTRAARAAAPAAKKPARAAANTPARAKSSVRRKGASIRARAATSSRDAARRSSAAFAPAFSRQRAEANPKDLLMFELARARVTVMAALQGVGAGTAMRPIAPGKWSPLEIVLHLAVRDRVRIDEIETTLAGRPATWLRHDVHDWARVNEEHISPLRHMSWDGAIRLLQTTRDQLLAAIMAVPAEPPVLWTTAHPFGAMLHALPEHDRHHAEQIKHARIEG